MLNESAYRDSYSTLNPLQCVFERALLRRCCGCRHAIRRNIAEREAVGCGAAEAHALCASLKAELRQAAAFVLKLAHPDEPLPHAKELKLQCGGLLGIAQATASQTLSEVGDVHGALSDALARYGALAQLPYPDILQAIRAFEPRGRRAP